MVLTAESTVESAIAGLTGSKVFFERLRGNNGDDLIVMGIEEHLRRHRIELVSHLDEADYLLIKGGGALLDSYPELLNQIEHLLHETEALPTIWLPTSYGLEPGWLPSVTGQRTAPLQIFARERYSFDAMSKMQFDGPVSIGLDHDSAFHLRGSEFVESLRGRKRRHILIVERTDKEALGVAELSPTIEYSRRIASMRGLLPARLRTAVRRRLERPRLEAAAIKTPFAQRALAAVRSDRAGTSSFKPLALDISSSRHCSFEEFADLIAGSVAVYTTRLHVGILAALLDIPTYLVDGVYHKIRGIFEYSMQGMPHVVLHTADGRPVPAREQ